MHITEYSAIRKLIVKFNSTKEMQSASETEVEQLEQRGKLQKVNVYYETPQGNKW